MKDTTVVLLGDQSRIENLVKNALMKKVDFRFANEHLNITVGKKTKFQNKIMFSIPLSKLSEKQKNRFSS